MKIDLRTRYSLIISALVLIVVSALAGVLLQQFRHSAEQMATLGTDVLDQELVRELQGRGEGMAEFLADAMAAPLYRLDMRELRRLLREGLAQEDVELAYVYDQEGLLIHDGSDEVKDYGRSMGALLEQFKARIDGAASEQLVLVSKPIVLSGERMGGISLALSLRAVSEQTAGMRKALGGVVKEGTRRTLYVAGLVTVFFLVAGILLAILVARGFVTPIRTLTEYARTVGRGEFGQQLRIQRGDELGELASGFQQMSNALAERTEEVRHMAYHDSLTDLPNRAHLREHLEGALARVRVARLKLAVLFIDLDDFKPVNDNFGHDAGDALLKAFAGRLADCMRFGDAVVQGDCEQGLIARLGGDEFTLVLEDIGSARNAAAVATRIIDSLKKPFPIGDCDALVGASIGIALCPDDGIDANNLLRHADAAMYAAKQSGKNRWAFYGTAADALELERSQLKGSAS